jgi:hypothetical protein
MSTAKTPSLTDSDSKLIEGQDYYWEGEAVVFTERYHLRRGYCCESGCRHCPFKEAWPKEPVTLEAKTKFTPGAKTK